LDVNVEDSVFVDIGCGKGRALLVAAAMGFRKAIGLEFSPVLCRAARENVSRYRPRSTLRPIEIHAVDASRHAYVGDETVFYMNNPFDGLIVEQCLLNIEISIREKPRRVWLVYMNPREHATILKHGLFSEVSRHAFAGGGRDFTVYDNSRSTLL
jgi:hypothetical protein